MSLVTPGTGAETAGTNGATTANGVAGPGPELTSWPMESVEIARAGMALFLWLALLTLGLAIPTKAYFDVFTLGTGPGWLGAAGALLVILFCHTATNTILLCCAAAYLGVAGCRAVWAGSQLRNADRSPYTAAVMRGFFVALVLQSGLVVFSQQPFSASTFEQYVRVASLASLVSFTVGYNPNLFQSLLNRVQRFTEPGETASRNGSGMGNAGS